VNGGSLENAREYKSFNLDWTLRAPPLVMDMKTQPNSKFRGERIQIFLFYGFNTITTTSTSTLQAPLPPLTFRNLSPHPLPPYLTLHSVF